MCRWSISIAPGRAPLVCALGLALLLNPHVCMGAGSETQPASEVGKPDSFLLVRIRGTIGRDFTAMRMKRYLEMAAKVKPAAVILEIDTPGGLTGHAESIVNLIIQSKDLRFIALVHRALSAGAPIVLACPEIYVTDVATIGAATSYRMNPQGEIQNLPPDVAEKLQSAWRAQCRKAAEHGGHPSILADAMIDPDFSLTVRTDGDRKILERNGVGKEVKARGRVLTLTAREAVAVGLAKGIVSDVMQLGEKIGLRSWEKFPKETVISPSTPQVRLGPRRLTHKECTITIFQKLAALNILDTSLTQLHRQTALEKWRTWVAQEFLQRRGVRRVYGTVTLQEAHMDLRRGGVASVFNDQLKNAEKRLKRERSRTRTVREGKWRRTVFTGDRETIRRLETKISELKGQIARAKHLARHCIKVYAYAGGEEEKLWITAWVSNSFRDRLADLPKGGDFSLSGEVTQVGLWVTDYDEIVPWMEMHSCTVITTPPIAPTTNPKRTAAIAPEDRAAARLRLAKMYETHGMLVKAQEILRSIIDEYPDTKVADDARKAMKFIDKEMTNPTK